jgi:ATP-dependent Zn protease
MLGSAAELKTQRWRTATFIAADPDSDPAWLQVTSKTQAVADFHMELLLKEAYEQVKEMVGRNRAALDVLVEALLANSTIRCARLGF